MISLGEIIKSKSKTFMMFCSCFLAGIVFFSWQKEKIDFVWLITPLAVLFGFTFIFRAERIARFVFLGLIIFTLALVRFNLALPEKHENYLRFYNGDNYSFTAWVAAEPDVRIDGVRYIMASEDEKGRAVVRYNLYPRLEYGDRVRLNCDLVEPEPIEDFRYDMYLAKFGVFSICYNPVINKIEGERGNGLMKAVLRVKTAFSDKVNRLWHEPYGSFMAGLLYGYRGGLGELQEDFNITGVSHIVAISGYNISIVAAILITFFVHLWIPRKRAFWLVSVSIILFIIFAGASASVVRAGVMGFLVLLAKQLGRVNRINNALFLVVVLMASHNPFVLVWDAGFQLSYLATLGLIYFSPALQVGVEKYLPWRGVAALRESFVSTLAAIIFTLPLTLYLFGRLSSVALLVNILILWLIPFLMAFGFAAVVLSFLFYPLGQGLAWLAWFGLKYITTVVEWFAGLPFAAFAFKTPLWLVILLYTGLFVLVLRLEISNLKRETRN